MAKDEELRRDYTGAELNVSCVRHVGHTKINKSRPGLGAHVHPKCYEVCYLRSGQLHWWAGTEDNTYVVNPGEMTLTFPDEVHGGVDSIHEACDLYWVSFETGADILGLSPHILDPVQEALSNAPRTFQADKSVPGFYEQILDTISEPGPYAQFRILSALQQIILRIVDAFNQEPKKADPRMEKVLHAISSKMDVYKSVEDLAEIAGLSPNRFINEFKAYTGYSPMDYLNREKLRVAKLMLADLDRSITDIAFELDFSTTQYFATMFKKYTGMTPTQFRDESL